MSINIMSICETTDNTKFNDLVLPIFSRHETFHPRFGWIKKGFDKATSDNEVFVKENAPVILGVGKNMVKAIRYWCYAFKVLDEVQIKGQTGRKSVPTIFGLQLLSENGWDPYLENPASLWLLHWNLTKPPCRAATWYFAFNEYRQSEFVINDLLSSIMEYKDRAFPSQKTVEASIAKDIHCLLRMYVEQGNYKGPIEDSIDCPFTELGLIQSMSDSKRYYFKMGNKTGLEPDIIGAACLDYASSMGKQSNTISVSRLLYDTGSPGLVFKITENTLCAAIEEVAKYNDSIYLSDSSGVLQLSYLKEPDILSHSILDRYYRR